VLDELHQCVPGLSLWLLAFYVADVKRNSSAVNMLFSSIKATLRKIKRAYITNVNGKSVFTKEDPSQLCANCMMNMWRT